MLELFVTLLAQLRAHDWKGSIHTFFEIVKRMLDNEEVPPITISKPGTKHPDDTTEKHTITLG
ncbi:MAG: hypothetical protein A2V70_19480 [Planctomycetes bacterium RBG_13_63_9]|nr:MAG: hypothetical protein A2V70_19480 [Planctomycetes bacterium RBG_13_63_9]